MSGSIQIMTFGIVGIIAVITVFALLRRRQRIDSQAPAILTSIGIFGTFLGITVGLAAFDPADISRSVPALFAGIQLAFWTSVAGILGGIMIKLRSMIWPLQSADPSASLEQDRAVMRDMLGAIQNVESTLSEQKQEELLPQLAALQSQAEAHDKNLLGAIEGISQHLGKASERETDAQQLLQGIQDAAAKLNEQMDSALSASESRDQSTEKALNAIHESTDLLREQLGSLLGEQLSSLQASVADSGQATTQSVRETSDAIAELRTALGGDNDKLLAGLAALRDGTSGLGEGLAKLQAQTSNDGDRASDKMQAIADSIKSLRTALGEDASQMLGQLTEDSNALADRLAQAFGNNTDRLAEALKAGQDRLSAALEGNRDAMAAQVMAAVTDIRDAIVGENGLAASMGERLQAGQLDLASTLEKASQQLSDTVNSQLENVQSDLSARSQSTSEQIHAVVDAVAGLKQALGEDSDALLGKLDSLRSGSAELSEHLGQVLNDNSTALAATLRDSNHLLADAIEGNRDAMAAQLTAAVKDIRDAMVGENGLAASMGERLQAGQIDVASALARASQQLSDTVNSQLENVQSDLSARSQSTSEQIHAVVDAVAGLKQALGEDSDALLGKLDSLRSGSAELSDHMSKVLNDNSTALAASLRDSNQLLATAIEGNRDVMAARIDEAVGQIRDALVGPDGASSLLGQDLQKGQLQLAQALARATQSMEEGVASHGQAMLDRIDGLNDGLAVLADSVSGGIGESLGGYLGDTQKLATNIMDAIDDLRLAITGPDGSQTGLVDEIRSAQEQSNKALSGIRSALEENTKRQVDYSPKALMEVLEEAIRNFNTQFSGQFWDKFGAFNKAIGELNDYMSAYRKQLSDMVEQQSKTARNMDTAGRRFDEIASRSEIFIDVSRNIQGMLGGLDSQRVQLEGHLKRFAHIVDATAGNLENIESRIIEGNSSMNEHLGDIANRIEEQVIRVDHALDEELTKALNSFGQQLAALSEKFVEDYTPLTNRLRDVVNIAKMSNGHAAQ